MKAGVARPSGEASAIGHHREASGLTAAAELLGALW